MTDHTTYYDTSTDHAPRGAETEESGFHPVQLGQLVMAVAFVGILGLWALLTSGNADLDDLRWLSPVPWIVAGVVGLLASVFAPKRRARERREREQRAREQWAREEQARAERIAALEREAGTAHLTEPWLTDMEDLGLEPTEAGDLDGPSGERPTRG